MASLLLEARPKDNHQSAIAEPAAEHPGLWSVVQGAGRARLIYPDGPDYRSLIVDYHVDGWGIEVELPMREVVPGDLDEREVTMEILDDYLSMTVEHVHLFGRVQQWDGAAPGARCLLGRHGRPARAYVIAVRLLALHGEPDERHRRSSLALIAAYPAAMGRIEDYRRALLALPRPGRLTSLSTPGCQVRGNLELQRLGEPNCPDARPGGGLDGRFPTHWCAGCRTPSGAQRMSACCTKPSAIAGVWRSRPIPPAGCRCHGAGRVSRPRRAVDQEREQQECPAGSIAVRPNRSW